MSGLRRIVAAGALAVAVGCSSHPSPPPSGNAEAGPITTGRAALDRANVIPVSGVARGQLRETAQDDQTFDLRGYVVTYWPPPSNADLSPISIGKGAPARGTVVVGGAVVGGLSRKATWQEVKACCDAEGLRLEGKGWMASFDFYAENVEDGFAPRVLDGTEAGSSDRFLISGAQMVRIRDDAVENDDLMSGTIRDSLFDGVNRFLSERPSSDRHYANSGSVVLIEDVLVRMEAMPNERAADGLSHGSIFKWSEGAGSVVMRDSVVLLEKRPVSSDDSNAFPPGRYSNVVVVLGPRFAGPYPVRLPRGVRVTRDVGVWTAARDAWLDRHGGGLAP
jgi:hypothetical protein